MRFLHSIQYENLQCLLPRAKQADRRVQPILWWDVGISSSSSIMFELPVSRQ